MSYRYRSADGLAQSNDETMIARWDRIGADRRHAEAAWVEYLRAIGVKAAHPDDGWVDRDLNSVQLVYPQFDAKPGVGDLIALGWDDKFRLVRVTSIEERGVLARALHYVFEPVPVDSTEEEK